MSGTVIAIGGLLAPDNSDESLHRYVLTAARRAKPRVCYLGLASGDYLPFQELFYEQYPPTLCTPTHLALVREVPHHPADVLALQDIVLLGGGSTPILVAGLRILGLDAVLRDVRDRGGVICGWSAGAHAMFRACITDSLGPEPRVFAEGLGIIDGSCAAHADRQRKSMLRSGLTSGRLASPAWAIEDGAAVTFSDDATHAVGWRPGAAVSVFHQRDADVDEASVEVTQI